MHFCMGALRSGPPEHAKNRTCFATLRSEQEAVPPAPPKQRSPADLPFRERPRANGTGTVFGAKSKRIHKTKREQGTIRRFILRMVWIIRRIFHASASNLPFSRFAIRKQRPQKEGTIRFSRSVVHCLKSENQTYFKRRMKSEIYPRAASRTLRNHGTRSTGASTSIVRPPSNTVPRSSIHRPAGSTTARRVVFGVTTGATRISLPNRN